MRRLRVFLFLLLSLAVPLQGYAHFAQPLVPCPMEGSAMMALVDAADAHDCCDDAETGQACKSGQPCQTGGQHFSVVTFGLLPQEAVPATRFPHIAADMSSFDPATAWRPPAQS
jgi:hypothetical protein